MKKKVFRERYNEVNTIIVEKDLTDKNKKLISNEKKITKRGRKNVKSSK